MERESPAPEGSADPAGPAPENVGNDASRSGVDRSMRGAARVTLIVIALVVLGLVSAWIFSPRARAELLAVVVQVAPEERRFPMIQEIGRLGAPAARPLARLVLVEDEAIRRPALEALSHLGEQGAPAIPEVVDLMEHHPDPETWRVAMTVALQLGPVDRAVLDAFGRAIVGSDRRRSAFAAFLIAQRGRLAVASLVPLLDHPDPEVVMAVEGALGSTEATRSVQSYLIAESSPELKVRVLPVLLQSDGEFWTANPDWGSVVPAIETCLAHSEVQWRLHATRVAREAASIRKLLDRDWQRPLEWLVGRLEDPEFAVRHEAAIAIIDLRLPRRIRTRELAMKLRAVFSEAMMKTDLPKDIRKRALTCSGTLMRWFE